MVVGFAVLAPAATVVLAVTRSVGAVVVAQVVLALLLAVVAIYAWGGCCTTRCPRPSGPGASSGAGTASWVLFLTFALALGWLGREQGVPRTGWLLTGGALVVGVLLVVSVRLARPAVAPAEITSPGELACRELVDLVTDLLDGVLPPGWRDGGEAHLADCDGCSEYVRRFAPRSALRSSRPARPPNPPRPNEATSIMSCGRSTPGSPRSPWVDEKCRAMPGNPSGDRAGPIRTSRAAQCTSIAGPGTSGGRGGARHAGTPKSTMSAWTMPRERCCRPWTRWCAAAGPRRSPSADRASPDRPAVFLDTRFDAVATVPSSCAPQPTPWWASRPRTPDTARGAAGLCGDEPCRSCRRPTRPATTRSTTSPRPRRDDAGNAAEAAARTAPTAGAWAQEAFADVWRRLRWARRRPGRWRSCSTASRLGWSRYRRPASGIPRR